MSAFIANCTPPAAAISMQSVPKPVAHNDAAHSLDDLSTDRHLSNPAPPLSDHSPTPRGATMPLDDKNASSTEQALSGLAVTSAQTTSTEGLFSLSPLIDWMRSCCLPVPPKIEAMLQDPDFFDRNGKWIATPAASGRVTDEARFQFILEQAGHLRDGMDRLTETVDALAFADPVPDSEIAAPRLVLTLDEVLRQVRSGGADELLRTGYGRWLVVLAVGLECLQLSYMLARERRAIEAR